LGGQTRFGAISMDTLDMTMSNYPTPEEVEREAKGVQEYGAPAAAHLLRQFAAINEHLGEAT